MDYDLEVHYHPVVPLTEEESSIRVSPDMSLQRDPHSILERGNHCRPLVRCWCVPHKEKVDPEWYQS
jgi:hypothetical protein